jgi:hypothetical protein
MAKSNDRPRDMANDIIGAIRAGTQKWTKTRKTEERSPASRRYRYSRMTRERTVSVKEAAAEIMPEAYKNASGDGSLPANARQIMYAARGHIQKVTGQELNQNYFTQNLLPNYVMETGVTWDVVYDARGHFNEPHAGHGFGIGTLEVRDYLKRFHEPSITEAAVSQAKAAIFGPSGNFGAVLIVEKEGFAPLLKAARIADRFDLAIMSTKGMSVVAARALADQMCFDHDIPLLLLHDFDKSGFSIAGTLQRDTRRYEFQNSIRVIDLGLSLDDVIAMGLESEYQHHPKGNKFALMANLRENGASEEEIEFMFRDFDRLRSTRRVELNAMTSPQFIAFLERKLREHGVEKIVPEQDLLAEAYAELERGRRLAEAIENHDEIEIDANVPKDLQDQVRKYLKRYPEARWDAAVGAIVESGSNRRRSRTSARR